MADELSDRLLPLLKEYGLPDVIQALSLRLAEAVAIADKAVIIDPQLLIALEYAEEKTFRTNENLLTILDKIKPPRPSDN